MAKVKNINGTSNNTCKCGSWLQHWEKYSGLKANWCSEINCLEKENLVGAHVQKADAIDTNWYIIPLCKSHNADTEEMNVMISNTLVLANIKLTCDK